ncbi:PREDICTED: protein phosphatase Slingshot isoform X1 [Rhagoletis zephyria]|uniref:protein phosphatase Slingshot isoform X1 n=1 Tax=Rhagoletis zephyria TaxID=28612 RepID=UPI00081160D9|nr:PREDICTED: protein phosphatase Slingshot isoform X1 [Rhagoletis zephyria]
MKSLVGEKDRKLRQMSMALVTVQRSPSVTGSPPQCGSEGEADDDDGNRPEKSECFFAGKATAMGLTFKDIPAKTSERRPSTDSAKSTNSTQSNNSDIQQHLQSMIDLLYPEETLKMAVKLESQRPNRTRYLVIVSRCCYRPTTTDRKNKIMRHNSTKASNVITSATTVTMRQSSTDSIQRTTPQQQSQTESSSGGEESTDAHEKRLSSVSLPAKASQHQSIKSDSDKMNASGDSKACEDGVEESCLLGIDCNERTTIGLVLPILADTTIHLDGDGGFSVSVYGKTHIFKPVSVQAMWSALQTLHKVSQKARENNFYPRGPSHDWTSYYDSHIESEQSCLNEWNAMDSLESRRPPSPDAIRNKPTAKEETESTIKMKLKEIMMSVDLDEVTSKYIRGRLEELLDMDLGEFKSFIDEEMLTILGQMDAPTEIFDHVYLGSEWNASNLEELQKNGIRHILNVTREIDNFFPGVFDYFNVRVYDDEKTNLLKHWDNTFRYITRAKSEGSKVLVHCKMGVSRSASVVIAYAMKAYNWEFKHALQHVKERRNCIKPNKNFLNQLETYRGMLDAMKNKEKLQRSKSETNLKSTKDARLLPGSEPTPLIQALNQSKSKSTGGQEDVSCGDSAVESADRSIISTKGVGRSKTPIGNDGGGTNEAKQRRLVRRSSSTSPQAVPHVPHMTVVIKQQSQSLENLTPEKSVAEEPKNMRFPGSNGENYSVTQNQVRHIQKNVQPPPPPPPPPPSSTAQQKLQQRKQKQQIASVRTRVQNLETHSTRKTADDRRSLNLQFGRSVSHDTGSMATRVDTLPCYAGDGTLQSEHSPVWTSSAKLITQTSNLKNLMTVDGGGGEGVSNESFASDTSIGQMETSAELKEEHQCANSRRHSRKTHSWTAASGTSDLSGTSRSGGIVLDRLNVLGVGTSASSSGTSKLSSNSSIDSISSSAGCPTTTAFEERVVTRTHRHRDLPSRHASWGSGDTRCAAPVRNSSWAAYDSNRNSCQYGGGAILEGQIHELNINKSNKTVTPICQGLSGSPHYQQHQHVGTVKRTKQKLEQVGSVNSCNTLKKPCPENSDRVADEVPVTGNAKRSVKGATNLFRSASAAGSTRIRCSPYRCNSVEIVPGATATTVDGNNADHDILTCHMVMRRSDGSRPLHNELFSASSAPESYTVSDIENKNMVPSEPETSENIVGGCVIEEDGSVLLRGSVGGATTITDQRISGTVQILKKNFEAKAGSSANAATGSSGNVLQIQTAATPAKKGHHSLPSSPVAQHIDPHHHHQHNLQSASLASPISDTTSATQSLAASSGCHDEIPAEIIDTIAHAATTTTATTHTMQTISTTASVSSTTASSASSSSSSSTSSSSSMCEPYVDRNVKVLVYKYQTPISVSSVTKNDSVVGAIPISSSYTTAPSASASSSSSVPTTVATVALATSHCKPRRHSYYESGGRALHKSTLIGGGRSSATSVRLSHEYSDSRPPPAPAKSTMISHGSAAQTSMADNAQNQQQQHQQRRLQQHGRTHPLSRLTLPKQSFNAAAYNTM